MTQGTDGYVYHATTEEKLASIAEEGLSPNDDRDTTFDGYPVSGRLYLSLTEAAVGFYASRLRDDFERDVVVLRFPAAGLPLSEDPYGNPSDRFTGTAIPPGTIEVRTETGWWPLVDVAYGQDAVPGRR